MAVLVLAATMDLGWAAAIATVVFVQKVLPLGEASARLTGVGLVAAAALVAAAWEDVREMIESWPMSGTVLIACNCCDYGCPCNFNALPTTGRWEGQWTWHVDEGA